MRILPLVYGLMKNGNNAASELAICLSQEAEGQAFLISNGIFKQDFGANNSQQHTSQMCIKISCLVIKRLLCIIENGAFSKVFALLNDSVFDVNILSRFWIVYMNFVMIARFCSQYLKLFLVIKL